MSDSETTYIREGTWLRDRSPSDLHSLGVVTHIHEDGLRDSRIGIEWHPDCYQNTSAAIFRENLREGRWEVNS